MGEIFIIPSPKTTLAPKKKKSRAHNAGSARRNPAWILAGLGFPPLCPALNNKLIGITLGLLQLGDPHRLSSLVGAWGFPASPKSCDFFWLFPIKLGFSKASRDAALLGIDRVGIGSSAQE